MSSIHALKLIAKTPENTPQKEGLIFQPSIFRGKLAVNFRKGSYKWNLYEFTTPINGLINGFPWIYFTPIYLGFQLPFGSAWGFRPETNLSDRPTRPVLYLAMLSTMAFGCLVNFCEFWNRTETPNISKWRKPWNSVQNARNFSGKLIKHHLFSKEQTNNLALWDLPT